MDIIEAPWELLPDTICAPSSLTAAMTMNFMHILCIHSFVLLGHISDKKQVLCTLKLYLNVTCNLHNAYNHIYRSVFLQLFYSVLCFLRSIIIDTLTPFHSFEFYSF